MYLEYDQDVHFYWEKAVCYLDPFVVSSYSIRMFSVEIVPGATGCVSATFTCRAGSCLRSRSVKLALSSVNRVLGVFDLLLWILRSFLLVPALLSYRCPLSSNLPSVPSLRSNTIKTPAVPSSSTASEVPPFGMIYNAAGAPLGCVSRPPTLALSRKRSALVPPSTAVPLSSKILCPSSSSSAIRCTSSAISSSPSLPSPLVFSPSLPLGLGSSSSPIVVDLPEDHVLLLLDAIEFAIDRGNLDDARMRIWVLRK
jgi:hypothetical protein